MKIVTKKVIFAKMSEMGWIEEPFLNVSILILEFYKRMNSLLEFSNANILLVCLSKGVYFYFLLS